MTGTKKPWHGERSLFQREGEALVGVKGNTLAFKPGFFTKKLWHGERSLFQREGKALGGVKENALAFKPGFFTLVSGNRHKFEEIRKILAPLGIRLKWLKTSLSEPEGLSLEETAKEKARQAFKIVKAPVITEDTGVFFEAFENFPGPKAKRVWEEIGFEGLLGKVKGKFRRARFETIICYTENGREFKCFKGELRGSLTEKVHDPEKDVLPYEKIFIPKGWKVTMSSISREEKNRFSHRAIAAKKFAEWLKQGVEKKDHWGKAVGSQRE